MRIIAGELGGRLFDSPHTHRTHPMGDRVRGALFGTLGDIVGLSTLDAFAGTGALGFEAVSRGAKSALLVENDAAAQKTIEANIRNLRLEGSVHLVRASCSGWSDTNSSQTFDLVLADPPFDRLQESVVSKLVRHIADDGVFVLNWPGKLELPVFDGLEIVEAKKFGDTQLGFYRPLA